jgi:protein-L-isoaspartate(D-aspartate) O-methyltransferase
MDPVSTAINITVSHGGGVANTRPTAGLPADGSSVEPILRLADLRPGHRVLHVGTGIGDEYTLAALTELVGPHGLVVSTTDANIIQARRCMAAENGRDQWANVVGDIRQTPDDRHGPYDRIIAFTTLPFLPQACLQLCATPARIVAPVSVAAVATATLVASVTVEAGRIRAILHPGPPPDREPHTPRTRAVADYPLRYVDAWADTRRGWGWLSALDLRHNPTAARALLRDLLRARRSLAVDEGDLSALTRFQLARSGSHLAAVSLPTGGGYGIVIGRSAAFIINGRYLCAGTHDAWHTLAGVVDDWVQRGRPDCATFRTVLTHHGDGWDIAIASDAIPRHRPAPAGDTHRVPRPIHGRSYLYRPH